MKHIVRRLALAMGLLACSAGVALAQPAAVPATDGFGKLPAIEGTPYGRYQRQSIYVPVKDGTRLAVDIYRPMTAAGVETKPLPVVFYYARYWRAKQLPDGAIMTNLGILPKGETVGSLMPRDASGRLMFWDTGRESIPELMRHGYIFVRAEGRGTGASEGVRLADYTREEAQDGADIIAWLAAQPWTTGKVGMIGGSYPGIMQLKVAAEAPPALKAIFPAAPAFDFYRLTTAGTGALHKGVVGFQATQARRDGLDAAETVAGQVVPVDADPDGVALKETLRLRAEKTPPGVVLRAMSAMGPEFAQTLGELAAGWGSKDAGDALSTVLDTRALTERLKDDPAAQAKALVGLSLYRDAPTFSNAETDGRASPHLQLDAMNAAAIPTYIWTGWYDMDTAGATLMFRNLKGPKKLTVGPWSHGPNEDNGRQTSPLIAAEARSRELLTAEAIRWFDYWLKGKDNGVMSEPAVHYGYAAETPTIRWTAAQTWPLPDARPTTLYFNSKTSGSVASVNDGGLSSRPQGKAGEASFTVDYLASLGGQSRYHDSFSGAPEMAYPDLVAHARTALTFTTAPLAEDMVLAGHPVITVDARSTAADGDLFFYLEDVGPDGVAYVTEAVLRASHRTPGTAPYDVAGLPFSDSRKAVVLATPAFNKGSVRLVADMQPSAYRFKAGHRIRLVITGADSDNYITVPLSPAPRISVTVGGATGGSIVLPLAPAK